ncbi:hypothetical protein TRP8649_02314 [Pelagimonas phthalicica]|uniref:Serine-threonine protein kinase n=1 Tax=Pelagimonas phthalicica TaxID=1037362 RepID=A0A238JC83_9RHOB|nr:hypothetical protein [Pelagimonas phthalicica]TDS91152.1 hypothetical protein CLV87_2316 [Pelagimonas phthalicica]SMX28199.1 hypothetical protein TRP8649_02314 [Pelagimonas phthalicica]
MPQLGPYPAHFIKYDKRGEADDRGHANDLQDFVGQGAFDDLLVISHGWRNDAAEAESLYAAICSQISALREGDSAAAQALAGRKVGVMAVFWPSKPYREFGAERAQLGGAASGATREEEMQALADTALADLSDALDGEVEAGKLNRLQARAAAAFADRDAFPSFFNALRDALPEDETAAERSDKAAFGSARVAEEVRAQIEAFAMAESGLGPVDFQQGGAAGGPVRTARASVGLLLNLSTFYTMKRRAGYVGQRGVARSLRGLRDARPGLRIHFVGHSFGARVLTMATQTIEGDAAARPDSLCLLQAAFSQNSFSARFPPGYRAGYFRPVMEDELVAGPILVSHTHNDLAVTWAYSLASLVSGQNASSLSDGAPSQYGGLGANGALYTDEAQDGALLPAGGGPYDLQSGRIYNLLADAFVKGHADIRGPEVGFAILSAMAASVSEGTA